MLDFALQPIRPVARMGYRFDRLPWNEVLLRHPEHADIEAFVQQSYRAGESWSLDLDVLRQAMGRMQQHCHYSVNVSVQTLSDPRFPLEFMRLVGASGLRPHRIVLEIVGRELADALAWQYAAGHAHQLNAQLGVQFAMGDLEPFDTLDSLKPLGRFPIRYLKLSTAFAQAWIETAYAPLTHVLHTALRLFGPGTEVIAEGIETDAQFRALGKATPLIAYWQGFYDEGRPAHFRLPGVTRFGASPALATA